MARKKRGPLGYIFSASILPVGLLFLFKEFDIRSADAFKAYLTICLFFLLLSLIWNIFGIISLIAERTRARLLIGVSMIIFQLGAYYCLWKMLGNAIIE